MGLKRTGLNQYAYDIHVDGARERPRGVFQGTIHKARAFVASEIARLKQTGSLTAQTVGEVLNIYLREHFQFTARYKESKAPFQAVLDGIGHYPLSRFKAADFLAWFGRMRAEDRRNGRKRRPDSLNGYIMIAKSAFNWVRKFHGYEGNPLAQVKRLDPENRQLWVYGPEHIQAILEAARGTPYHPFFLAMQYWPVRRNELLNLRGCDVFRRYIRLPDESNKTKVGRTLPIPEDAELKAYLAVIPRDCPHVFCTAGKNGFGRVALDGRNLLRWLKERKETLNLPGTTLHGFRRTAAVRLDEAGVSLPVIAELTGHRDLRTLQFRYLPVSQRAKENAMEKLVLSINSGQILDKKVRRLAAA